jgi:hypothetical protein
VLLAAAAQVLLPRLAADRISSRIGRYGRVQSVSVSAWPAVQLLWGSAGSVGVRAGELRASPAESAKLLWEGRGVSSIDMSASGAQEGPLKLRDITLRKRGGQLSAQAFASAADVSQALPAGLSVALLESAEGRVRVRATGGLFGVQASVQAVAEASEGKLIVHPVGFPLEGVRLTLFSDPHVYVTGVGASAVSVAGGESGYRLTMSAILR